MNEFQNKLIEVLEQIRDELAEANSTYGAYDRKLSAEEAEAQIAEEAEYMKADQP